MTTKPAGRFLEGLAILAITSVVFYSLLYLLV